jgi:hypothetical protein
MTNWISCPQFNKDTPSLPFALEMEKAAAAAQKLGFQILTYHFSASLDFSDLSSDTALMALPLYFEAGFAGLKSQDVLVLQLSMHFLSKNSALDLWFLEELKSREIRLVGFLPRWLNDLDLSNTNHRDFVHNVLSFFEVLITASSGLIELAETCLPELKIVQLDFIDFLASNTLSKPSDNREKILSVGEQEELSELDIASEIIAPAALDDKALVTIERGMAWLGSTEQKSADLDLIRLSYYLATGQVILASEKSEFASFIENEELGLIVRKEEPTTIGRQMPEVEYHHHVQKIRPFQHALDRGVFTQLALLKALQYLNLGWLETAGESSHALILKKWLTSRIFYYCAASDYKKFGIWRFEENGNLSGVGGAYEKYWRLRHRKLEILDSNRRIVSFFWLPSKLKKETASEILGFRQTNYDFQLLLIPTELKEIETLQLDSVQDSADLKSFMRVGSEPYQQLRTLMKTNKVIDGSYQHQYFVVPAKDLALGLPSEFGIPYQLELPADTESFLSRKLIVCFSVPEKADEADARQRLISDSRTRALSGLIAKNTFILRPVELAEQNEPHEIALQKLILKVAEQNEISRENIFLYGYGASGLSALIHALLGEYPVLAFEPDVSVKKFSNGELDANFGFDDFERKLNEFNQLLNRTKMRPSDLQIVFPEHSSDQVRNEINQTKCTLYDFETNENESAHSERLLPIELALINQRLYAVDIENLTEEKLKQLLEQNGERENV